jgi:TonB family protein
MTDVHWYAGRQGRSFGAALAIQISGILLLLLIFRTPQARNLMRPRIDNILLAPYPVKSLAARKSMGIRGGGGQRAPTPAPKGTAPQFAPKPFIPPAVAVAKPRLAVVPQIAAQLPPIEAAVYGDPLSNLTGNSPGPGINGLGSGSDGGLGPGKGPGYGPGGDGSYTVGGDVSSPRLILKVEPEYSDEARKAKYSGTVQLAVVVDEHGIPRDIHVVRYLGLGLDEKAVEAVGHWRFQPGLRNGKPVRVQATIEVSFRLL